MRFCSSLCRQATLFLVLLVLATALPVHAESDDRALAVARQTMEAMGGVEAWNDTQFLLFTFTVRDGDQTLVERTHFWDKWDQRHRVEGMNREGLPYVVIMDLESKTGRAWLNGEPQSGEDLDQWLDRAWSMWVNDTYWLLMPYKLTDPGVNLTWVGEERLEGQAYDKLHLSFEGVGLTPGDQYWAWINRETGLMDRWAFVLQDQEPPARAFEWKPWRPYGKIMLASDRIAVDGPRDIVFTDLAVPDSLPESIFTSLDAPTVTTLVIRATSRDAKIIGSGVGGARITIRNADTGEILSEGIQTGGTGDTGKIIREPHPRDGTIYDTAGAASFLASFLLDGPTNVEIVSEGPLDYPQVDGRASKKMLVLPGADIRGEGVLLEIHGFIVEILDTELRNGTDNGERLFIRARLRMT